MKKDKKSKIRVGVIGVGGIGDYHLRCMAKVPEVEAVAICDTSKAACNKITDCMDIQNVFTDYRQMLKMKDLDVAVVALPNYLHAPATLAALQAGKHVMCEKPLADTLANGKKIVDAVKKSKKTVFSMSYYNRFRGECQLLKKYIESGDLGDIYYAKCGWLRREGIPGYGGWFTQKKLAGGGPMIDLGVHVMDLTLWLMGFPKPVSAYGSTYAKFGERGIGVWGEVTKGGICDTEDLATGMVKFGNGATMAVEASWAQNCDDEKIYLEVYGTDGGAKLDEGALTIYTRKHGTLVDFVTRPPKTEAFVDEWRHFVKCISKNAKPMGTIEEGYAILQIIDGIYKSAKTGGSTKL